MDEWQKREMLDKIRETIGDEAYLKAVNQVGEDKLLEMAIQQAVSEQQKQQELERESKKRKRKKRMLTFFLIYLPILILVLIYVPKLFLYVLGVAIVIFGWGILQLVAAFLGEKLADLWDAFSNPRL
ncbi:MAG: hypothetical protein ACE5K8_08385 [Candidatus Zixiibacteriota bacterium]